MLVAVFSSVENRTSAVRLFGNVTDFTETVKKLNNTPGGASRPEATGGSGAVMADC